VLAAFYAHVTFLKMLTWRPTGVVERNDREATGKQCLR
jgi:hypothetical protein